jgi:hypothetical protein
VKRGDLVKKRDAFAFREGSGLGIIVATDSIDTACGRVTLKVKVRWQGDYGTFSSPPENLELLSEAR